MILKFMDELTYEEIAERLGIGISAAKMRLSRIMEKLKKELKV